MTPSIIIQLTIVAIMAAIVVLTVHIWLDRD